MPRARIEAVMSTPAKLRAPLLTPALLIAMGLCAQCARPLRDALGAQHCAHCGAIVRDVSNSPKPMPMPEHGAVMHR